jgi:hypothetical protein
MSDKIEAALTSDEWKALQWSEFAAADMIAASRVPFADRPLAIIAILNAALPDSDPRKITREWIQSIRDSADAVDGEWGVGKGDHPIAIRLAAIADALESYLPESYRPPKAR